MHPIEHLRYLARAAGADPVELASAAAHSLAGFARDPVGLVAAGRSMVARHPGIGPVWWAACRVLVSPEPGAEAEAVIEELEGDPTGQVLGAFVPDEARVLIVGWPPATVPGLARRGDLDVLAADDGTGVDVGRALSRVDIPVVDIPSQSVGAAASVADIVVLEAEAAGPSGALVAPGSLAAAAVAQASGRQVWLVTPVGRVLPGPVYDVCVSPLVGGDDPWDSRSDVLPAELVDRVLGPDGPVEVAEGLARATCPVAPELLVPPRTPGSHRRP